MITIDPEIGAYQAESDYWWRVTQDVVSHRVIVELAPDTALALAKRDGYHTRPGARKALKELQFCIGEAVE